MMIVDLPMPGSPEISTSEPRTRPPPSTRLNSPIPVSILLYSLVPTSLSRAGPAVLLLLRLESAAGAAGSGVSSTNEFHAPHTHCPIHVGLS